MLLEVVQIVNKEFLAKLGIIIIIMYIGPLPYNVLVFTKILVTQTSLYFSIEY